MHIAVYQNTVYTGHASMDYYSSNLCWARLATCAGLAVTGLFFFFQSSSFLLKKSITDENYCKSQKKRLFVRSRSLFRKNNLPRNVASKEDKRRQPIFAKVSVAVNQPKLTDQRKAFRKHNLKSLSENSTSSLSISLENNTKVSGDLKNDRPETCTRSLTDHLPFICDEYDVTQSLLTRVKSESACISSKTFPSDELLTAPLTCGKCNPEKPSLLCADKSCNGRCTDNRVSARGCRSLTFSRSLLRNSLIIHRQNIVRKRRLCKELRHDFPKLQINRRKAKQLEKVSNPVERFSAATEKNDCSCLSMVYKNLRESKVCCKIQTNHQLMENRKTPDPEEGTQMCKNFTKMKEMLETHDSQQSAIVSSSCDATSAGSESISAGSSLSVFVGDTWSTDGNEVGDSKLPRLSRCGCWWCCYFIMKLNVRNRIMLTGAFLDGINERKYAFTTPIFQMHFLQKSAKL